MTANQNTSSHSWWRETDLALGGDGDKMRVLRRLADALEARPLWKLVDAELGPLKSATSRNVSGPRLAFALLLDACDRHAHAALPPLVKVLASAENLGGFRVVGLLATALELVWRDWAQTLAPAELGPNPTFDAVLRVLAAPPELVAWEPALTQGDEAGRRRQAELILSARAGANLREVRLGVLGAGLWARDAALQARLLRVGGTLEPRSLFVDLTALATLAALRLRVALAASGRAGPVPDATLFDLAPEAARRLLTGSPPSPPQKPTASTPADPPAPPAAPVTNASPPPSPTPTTSAAPHALPSDWWQAAVTWSQGQGPRLQRLLDRTRRLADTKLWPLVEAEVKRAQPAKLHRRQESARLAFACLVDELRRAFPLGPTRFFDLVAGEDAVDLGLVGRLWTQLEPLVVEWARELAPAIEPENKGALLRALHTHGDILPWDEAVRGSPDERKRTCRDLIRKAYAKKPPAPEEVRRGVYWAATWARNESAHGTAQDLADAIGDSRAPELLDDVLALAALASLRFKLRWAELHRLPATLPDVSKIEALIRPGFGPDTPRR